MNRQHQTGFSLIELMVSVAIGLLIVAGVTALIATASASRSELEKANRQIENGRYAFEVIANDLQHAGFYGLYPAPKVSGATIPDVCSTSPAVTDLSFVVQGISNFDKNASNPSGIRSNYFSCLPADAILAGTDVIAVRRATTSFSTLSNAGVAAPALDTSALYVQTGLVPDTSTPGQYTTGARLAVAPSSGLLATYSATLKDAGTGTSATNPATFNTPAPVRKYVVHIYFISPCSEPVLTCTAANTPTLKRLILGGGPAFSTTTAEVIAEGIEDLQIDYGADNTGTTPGGTGSFYDGIANQFLQCNAASSTAYETECLWQDVVSAKVHLLARNVEKSLDYKDYEDDPNSPYYNKGRVYNLGLKGATTAKKDNYKRHVYAGLVRLNNVSMNRECTPTSTEGC